MVDDNKLRGLIYEKCETKSVLAKRLGWTNQKLNWILKNSNKLRLEQVQEIITALGMDSEESVARIFLPIAFK